MVVAKKRLPSSSFKISAGKHDLPGKKTTLCKLNVTEKTTAEKQKPAEPDPLPFDKWNIPQQEERYIKGREHDFL